MLQEDSKLKENVMPSAYTAVREIAVERPEALEGLPLGLALYWAPGQLIALSPTATASGLSARLIANAHPHRALTSLKRSVGSLNSPLHLRIVLTRRAVLAYVSGDGVHFFLTGSQERGSGRWELRHR